MVADVAALNDPDLTSRRADVSGELVSNQAERVRQARAAADFVKDLAYSVFSGCRHCKRLGKTSWGFGNQNRSETHSDSSLSACERQ